MKTPVRQTKLVKETRIRLGQNIAAARKAKGWTQNELALRCGIDGHSLSRLETAATTPSFLRLIEIAEALEVGLSTLVGGTTGKVGDVTDEINACLKRLREPDRQLLLQVMRLWTDRMAKK